ncbi:MAG: hypothetical protein H6605_11245 [Flavobacteriales bacterium]|nr:hypothetical protein [Flavobacteriales bacterium]
MNKSENKKVKTLFLLGMVGLMTSAEAATTSSSPIYTEGFDPKSDPDYCEINYDDDVVEDKPEDPFTGYPSQEPHVDPYVPKPTPVEHSYEPVPEPEPYDHNDPYAPIIFDHPVIYKEPVVYEKPVTYEASPKYEAEPTGNYTPNEDITAIKDKLNQIVDEHNGSTSGYDSTNGTGNVGGYNG